MAPFLDDSLSRDIPISSPGNSVRKMDHVAIPAEFVPGVGGESEDGKRDAEPRRPVCRGHQTGTGNNTGIWSSSSSSSFFTACTDSQQQDSPSSTIQTVRDGESPFSPWGGRHLTFLPPPPPPPPPPPSFSCGGSEDCSLSMFANASSGQSSVSSCYSQEYFCSSVEAGGSQRTTVVVQEEGEGGSVGGSSSQVKGGSPRRKTMSHNSQDSLLSERSSMQSRDGERGMAPTAGDTDSKNGRGAPGQLGASGKRDLITPDAGTRTFAADRREGADTFLYQSTEQVINGHGSAQLYPRGPSLPGRAGGHGEFAPSRCCARDTQNEPNVVYTLRGDQSIFHTEARKEAHPGKGKDSREVVKMSGNLDGETNLSSRQYASRCENPANASSIPQEERGNEGSCTVDKSNNTSEQRCLQSGEQRPQLDDADKHKEQVPENLLGLEPYHHQGHVATEELEVSQRPLSDRKVILQDYDPQRLLHYYDHRELLLKLLASSPPPAESPGAAGMAPHAHYPESQVFRAKVPSVVSGDENANGALRCLPKETGVHSHAGCDSNRRSHFDSTESTPQGKGTGLPSPPFGSCTASMLTRALHVGASGAGGGEEGQHGRRDEGRGDGQEGRGTEGLRRLGPGDRGSDGVGGRASASSGSALPFMIGRPEQKQQLNVEGEQVPQVKGYGESSTQVHINKTRVLGTGDADVDPFYKTKMCPFMKGGRRTCPKEDNCTFAHTPSELRAPPDFRKTKLCRYSNGHRSICARGSRCTFAHSISELEPLTVRPYSYFHNRRFMRGGVGGLSRRSNYALSAGPSGPAPAAKNTPSTPVAGGLYKNDKGHYEVGADFLPIFNDFLTKVLQSRVEMGGERGASSPSTSPSLRNGTPSTAAATLSSDGRVPAASRSSSSTCSSSLPVFPSSAEEFRGVFNKGTPTSSPTFRHDSSVLPSSPVSSSSSFASSSSSCDGSPSSLSSSSDLSLPRTGSRSEYPAYPLSSDTRKEETTQRKSPFVPQHQGCIPRSAGTQKKSSDSRPDVSLLLPSLTTLLSEGVRHQNGKEEVRPRQRPLQQTRPENTVADKAASIMQAVSLFQGLYEASSTISSSSSTMTQASSAHRKAPTLPWHRPCATRHSVHSRYASGTTSSPVAHSLGGRDQSSGPGSPRGLGGSSSGDGGGGASDDITHEDGGRGTPLRKTRRGKRGGRKKRGGGGGGGGGPAPHHVSTGEEDAHGGTPEVTGDDGEEDGEESRRDDSPPLQTNFGFQGESCVAGAHNVLAAPLVPTGGEGPNGSMRVLSQMRNNKTPEVERGLREGVMPAALTAEGLSDLAGTFDKGRSLVGTSTWYHALASQLALPALQQQKQHYTTTSTASTPTTRAGGGVDMVPAGGGGGGKRDDSEGGGSHHSSRVLVPGVPSGSPLGCASPPLPSIGSLPRAETARKGIAYGDAGGGVDDDDEVAKLWNCLRSGRGGLIGGTPRQVKLDPQPGGGEAPVSSTASGGNHSHMTDQVARKLAGITRDEFLSLAALLVRAAESSPEHKRSAVGDFVEGAIPGCRE